MVEITCPWYGRTAHITYEEDRLYQLKCSACHNAILHEDRGMRQAVEFFTRIAELARADREKRCVLLPNIPDAAWRYFTDGLHDYFTEAMAADPEVGIHGMSDEEVAIADALMAVLNRR